MTWLDDRFPAILSPPPPDEQRDLLRTLAAAGRIGGSVYDGLVALSAKLAGATLVTADARATTTYQLIGVELRRIGLTSD
jgi:hypothetical protein